MSTLSHAKKLAKTPRPRCDDGDTLLPDGERTPIDAEDATQNFGKRSAPPASDRTLEISDAVAPPPRADDATHRVGAQGEMLAAAPLPQLEGYEILAELGRGGMGVVYKAWQYSLSRVVAVKMVLGGAFAGADDLQRFQAEARAVARLHHPNLLSIYEIGQDAQLPFFAMEYIEGGTLAQRLNGQPLPPRARRS